MTLEERVYKLEGLVEGVMATLPARVEALEGRMDLLRQELKAELQALRQEVRQEIRGLRGEVKAEIGAALNKAMLYFTALAVLLALVTFTFLR